MPASSPNRSLNGEHLQIRAVRRSSVLLTAAAYAGVPHSVSTDAKLIHCDMSYALEVCWTGGQTREFGSEVPSRA